VKSLASKYEPSYDDGNGEIAAAWNDLGLNPPDDPFKITDNGGVVVTKEIDEGVKAIVSPLQYASFTNPTPLWND